MQLKLAGVALLASAAPASAAPYTAPDGKVLVGVAGGRTIGGYARAADKRRRVWTTGLPAALR